jgi:uroporphyrinogen-III decarboxylase
MLRGTLAEVATDAHRCIQELSPGGGFILSTGGGMAPGTKRENIDALLQAARG